MKNAGIICLVLGIVLIISAFAFAEGYREEQGMIDNLGKMELVMRFGADDREASATMQQADEGREAGLRIRSLHVLIGGVVFTCAGVDLLFLYGLRKRKKS
jgi:hypothetical protein